MAPSGMGRGVRVGGIGGLGIVALALVAMFLGVDPSIILSGLPGDSGPEPAAVPRQRPAGDDQSAQFISVVLAQTEDAWTDIFRQAGKTYEKPPLVLFDGRVESACGLAGAATGPFYCPADRKVYLDLSFFDELDQKFGAPGDFAQAYVVAHEVGHHVQTLLGISRQVTQLRQQSSEAESNRLSVMMELQADCLAGVWARHTHDTAGRARRGRHRRGPGRGQRGRRRPDPGGDPRLRGAGRLHPRQLAAAHALVPAGPADGGHQQLRHVQRGAAVRGGRSL